jgi:hypothetical protein
MEHERGAFKVIPRFARFAVKESAGLSQPIKRLDDSLLCRWLKFRARKLDNKARLPKK